MLGLLWFLQRRIARRSQRSREAEVITVLGRRGVGAKAQLVVAEAEGNRYVLGVTEHGVTVIDKLPGRRSMARKAEAPARGVEPAGADVLGQAPAAPAGSEFDRLFAAETAREADAAPPLRRDLAAGRPADRMHGSILSPVTWRQTVDFLRRPR